MNGLSYILKGKIRISFFHFIFRRRPDISTRPPGPLIRRFFKSFLRQLSRDFFQILRAASASFPPTRLNFSSCAVLLYRNSLDGFKGHRPYYYIALVCMCCSPLYLGCRHSSPPRRRSDRDDLRTNYISIYPKETHPFSKICVLYTRKRRAFHDDYFYPRTPTVRGPHPTKPRTRTELSLS